MTDVYVVHEPSRWDRVKGRMVKMDLQPATQFGALKIVFPGADRPPEAAKALPQLSNVMARFQPTDYLLLAGDWDIVIWAALLAAKRNKGQINLLKWNNRANEYDVIAAPPGLWEDDEIPVNT